MYSDGELLMITRKRIGRFEICSHGWLAISCPDSPDVLEILFNEGDIPDLEHAVSEIKREVNEQRVKFNQEAL